MIGDALQELADQPPPCPLPERCLLAVGRLAPEKGFDVLLEAYALAHLRLAWQINAAWRIEARVENLTDRDYTLVYGYNTPGRSGVLNLVWNGK